MQKNSKRKPATQPWWRRALDTSHRPMITLRRHIDNFLSRRPHRSFRLTRRRDYQRALDIPGLISFTHLVNKTLWRHRKIFLIVVLIYGLLTAALVGIGSQETYTNLTELLRDSGSQLVDGNANALGEAGLIFVSIASAGLTETLTESQQIFSVLIGLLVWLTTVWLLRGLLAGQPVKVRDGLYNAGAPIVALFLLGLVLLIQLLPVAVAAIGFGAASSSGLLNGGIEAALFWTAAGMLGLLSLYWISTTLLAMVIVTLPGMYPLKALGVAGDLLVGRRIRLMIRIVWMVVCAVIGWAVLLIPFILLDTWLKGMWSQIAWVPIIPVVLVIVTSLSIVWVTAYTYLLYRKVVESGDTPTDK